MIRRLTPVQLAADLVVALLFGLFCWAIESRGVTLGTSAVLVVMTVALLARRLNPAAALGFAWLGAILQMALSVSAPSFADLAALGVLYCTASYGGRVVRWLGLASAVAGAVIATLYLELGSFTTSFGAAAAIDFARAFLFPLFGLLALLGLSWTLGLLTRTYRRARDSRRAQALAEKDVVVEQERNRIARDMHDVVAHSLAVVIAQADGARYAAAKDPAAVDAALTTISTTAREALGDVRLLLTQLRHSQGDGPQPALGDLDRLVEQFRAAGLDVQRSDRGSAGLLASGQQLALFRIVQEALTNALRHGDTSQPVVLAFDWAEPVSVVISNALGDSAPHPGGHGVVGMRERAALVAGTLTAGANGDRWVVAGTVPS
ncbi:MAG: histidine kinase [Actinomycetota bacterium]